MDMPPSQLPSEDEAPEPSSLTDRLTNVIAAPGPVFSEVRNAPVRTANWLAPLVLVCLAAVLYSFMALSQPGVLHGMEEAREKAMDKQIAAGKLTRAQADKATEMTAKFLTPTILRIFGGVGAVCASTAGLFLMALGIWLLLKLCVETSTTYMKIVEVCGLALVIDIPQKIIRTWLVSWKENMLVTLSPTLLVDNPDLHSRKDVLLSMIDPIDFWWLAVLSLGVSKVAAIPYRTAAFITFGLWFGFRVLAMLLTPAA